MTRLFWMGYCSHAPLVLMRRGNDFVVLRSAEGSRMGDKFGSFAFDLAVHPAYLEIQATCPSVVFQAATDDLKSYARDPLDLCRMFPIASAAIEKHAGVRFNPAKSAILLAAGHADLDPADVPEGVQIKRDGTVVVGAAVGTDQFVQDHLMAVVRQATRKFEALDLLDHGPAVCAAAALWLPCSRAGVPPAGDAPAARARCCAGMGRCCGRRTTAHRIRPCPGSRAADRRSAAGFGRQKSASAPQVRRAWPNLRRAAQPHCLLRHLLTARLS